MTFDATLTAYVQSFYWLPFALVVALVAACYVMTRGGRS